MKKHFFLLVLLAVFFTNTFFQCDHSCESDEIIPLKVEKIELKHLDTRGTVSKVLSPGDEGLISNYGFRLLGSTVQVDSTQIFSLFCNSYFLEKHFLDVQVITLADMGAAYPAGSNVSSLFRYQNGSSLAGLNTAGAYLNNAWALQQGVNYCDFLLALTHTEEGWHQFEVKFAMSDTTQISVVSDSIYLK